ncbi:uncharacterized protein G2W53_028833 [Senna tora]|uniref:Uncharacterized protein n=1 Tax=Senna tora TaxID=362788 RepID=A0A834WF56_9FABA|nr:uncharacterized protein G2W53_028833 [Senna tora]
MPTVHHETNRWNLVRSTRNAPPHQRADDPSPSSLSTISGTPACANLSSPPGTELPDSKGAAKPGDTSVAAAAFGVHVRTKPSEEPGITPSPSTAPTTTPPRSLSATTPWPARLCGGSALSRASPSNRWRTRSPETSSLSATTPWRARLCGSFALSGASPSDRWRTCSPKTSTTGSAVSMEERTTTTFTF